MPFLGQQMRGERGRSQGLHQSVCVRVDACEENGEGRQEEEGKGGGRRKRGRQPLICYLEEKKHVHGLGLAFLTNLPK